MAGFQGTGDAAAAEPLQRIEAAIMQQAPAMMPQAASTDARFAYGGATMQCVVPQLEGRLVDSGAELAQALAAIQAGPSAIEGRIARSATRGRLVADARSGRGIHRWDGCPIPDPGGGRRTVPEPRRGHSSLHGRTDAAGV